MKKSAKCTAVVSRDRISLVIGKNETGYADFVRVLNRIQKNGLFFWLGDVTDPSGKERCGLNLLPCKG